LAQASEDFRFVASVAAYGMLLRSSEHRGAANWKMAVELAKGALGKDSSGRRAEYVKLVEIASRLMK
jgi:Ca-activated chloride channel family protein